MANWNDPTVSTAYATVISEFKDRDTDLATMFDVGTPTNISVNSIRFNITNKRFEQWDGNSWIVPITDYAITVAGVIAGGITSAMFAAGAVNTAALGQGSVTSIKIDTGAVGSTQLATSAVSADKIASNAVISAKINALAVTSAKIANGAVGATQLATNAVTTAKIAAAQITLAKMATNSVDTAQLVTDSVTASKMADKAVGLGHIQDFTAGQMITWGSSGAAAGTGVGTSGQVMTSAGAGQPAAWADNPFVSEFLHIRDEKAANTSGGGFTAGAWRTRDLNTIVTNEITGASLSSNQITLPIGTYHINMFATAHRVRAHKVKLRNISDSSDDIIGSSEQCHENDQHSTRSTLSGRLTVSGSSKTFELQHRCTVSKSTDGFGFPANVGVVEIYSEVQIWKIG